MKGGSDAPTPDQKTVRRVTLSLKIADRLETVYLRDPVKVGTALDHQVDPSGNLLGWLRDYVRRDK